MDDPFEPGPSSAYYRRFAPNADGPIRPPSPSRAPLIEPAQTGTQFLDAANDGALYAILNVERDASSAEIRERYRTLAAMYHPDKQPDDARRQAAHERFQAIQQAYEILSDTQRRAIYDMFGPEGLRTSWELGPANMRPEAIRAHFQKQAETKRQRDAEALVMAKSTMNIALDAQLAFSPRAWFKRPEQYSFTPWARAKRVRPRQVLMQHSFEIPVDERTQFVLDGALASVRGHGGGSVSGTIKHQFSPRLWMSFSQSCLQSTTSTLKATWTFDENTYLTGHAIRHTWLAPPSVTLQLGRKLWPETTGFISFDSGFWALGPWGAALPMNGMMAPSALSVGVTTQRRDASGWTMEVQTGLASNAVSVDWRTSALGLLWKIGGMLSFTGASMFVDASGQITENTRAGATAHSGLDGVQFKLYFNRMGQKVQIPIHITNHFNLRFALITTVAPAATWAAAYYFWLLPRRRQKTANRIKELREEHADYISQKRHDAEAAVLLMEQSVSAKAQAERRKNGLVILSAYYGRGAAFTAKGMVEDEAIIDVTVPIQALVQNSRIHIPAGAAKFNLLGFWDPCIGEHKKLRVRYLFQGVVHEVTVDDVGILRAPVRAHAIE